MKFVLALLSLVTFNMAHAEHLTGYDEAKLRATLLQFKNNPPSATLVIQGRTQDAKKLAFLHYYQSVVFPKFQEYSNLVFRYRALSVLVDARMAETQEQHEAYDKEFQAVREEANHWSVDTQWTEILKTWSDKSQGLEGQLPKLARRMHTERQLEYFPERLKPLLDEASHHEHEYMMAKNEVPAAAGMRTYGGEAVEIRRKFKSGEITFQEAQRQIQELMSTKGPHFVGAQAVAKAGESLNKMAKIRAQLAKEKGVPTWAAYALETSGQGYMPEYRGPQNQREFLRKYIAALVPLRNAFIERRIRELNLESERATLRQNHISLLTLPGLQQLQPYFPKSEIQRIWEETLLESGWTAADLQQITADIDPRKGKNPTSAYMNGFTGPYAPEEVVDAESLNEIFAPKGSPVYKPGFVYILQNFAGAGLSDLSVLFHEGGHALEKLLKFKTDPTDEAYGYVEVPSMTSERFATDVEILFNKAIAYEGRKPTRAEIEKLVANDDQNEIVSLLSMAVSALFDLELWDYDYSAPGAMTYLERVELVDRETSALAGNLPWVDTPVAMHFWNVATPHFVSGSVRNIGYTYAEIASRMMSKFFSDELERTTGRRSWHQQPTLARLFNERFFEVGWKTQFPSNIEQITGQRFSAEDVVKEMAEQMKRGECETKLL